MHQLKLAQLVFLGILLVADLENPVLDALCDAIENCSLTFLQSRISFEQKPQPCSANDP